MKHLISTGMNYLCLSIPLSPGAVDEIAKMVVAFAISIATHVALKRIDRKYSARKSKNAAPDEI